MIKKFLILRKIKVENSTSSAVLLWMVVHSKRLDALSVYPDSCSISSRTQKKPGGGEWSAHYTVTETTWLHLPHPIITTIRSDQNWNMSAMSNLEANETYISRLGTVWKILGGLVGDGKFSTRQLLYGGRSGRSGADIEIILLKIFW